MVFFEDIQTLVTIGPISIKWYAVLILTGAFIAYFISLSNLKKMGYYVEQMENLFYGVLIAGVIGSRLWFIAFYDLSYYLANPLAILMTWEGGLAIQGGLFFGGLFGWYYVRKHKMSFFRLADAIVPTILIAQALGRWGNFLNQEAFGRVVDASFYNGWPSFIADNMFINGAYREPTFLYESALNILGYILIVYVYKKFSSYKRGDLMYAYLMWYGVTRYFVEGFRSDSLMFLGLRSAQLVSILFVLVGIAGTLGVFRKLVKKEKPIILFDLDGTLLDTEAVIVQSYIEIFKRHKPDLQISDELKTSLMGPPLKVTFGRFFKEFEIEGLIQEYREINLEHHKTLVKPIKHAKEVVERLKSEGYTLGIVSSKLKEGIEIGLDMFNMREYFDVIVGLDDVKEHKPHPEGIFKACKELGVGHDNVVYVGDTVVDVETGDRAGVYVVALVSSEKRRIELVNSNPNRVIDDLNELVDILSKEIVWTRSMI